MDVDPVTTQTAPLIVPASEQDTVKPLSPIGRVGRERNSIEPLENKELSFWEILGNCFWEIIFCLFPCCFDEDRIEDGADRKVKVIDPQQFWLHGSEPSWSRTFTWRELAAFQGTFVQGLQGVQKVKKPLREQLEKRFLEELKDEAFATQTMTVRVGV